MNIDDSETSEKRYTLRPTSTPLPSKAAKCGNCRAATIEEQPKACKPHTNRPTTSSDAHKATTSPSGASASSPIRAANEDDDLYDPYSDYHDGNLKAAEFEEDPWR